MGRGAVCCSVCRAWMGSHLRGNCGGDRGRVSCWGECCDAGFAPLCADASDWCVDVLLYAVEVDSGYALARGCGLGGGILVFGKVEARRGVTERRCSSGPLL